MLKAQRLVLPILAASLAVPITARAQSYRISTYAGGGDVRDGGAATNAYLTYPEQTAFDKAGNLYICDSLGHRVRIQTPDGNIRTFAGTGVAGTSGDGGPASAAQLDRPQGVAVDAAGNVWIGQRGAIRQVQANGNIRTVVSGGGIDLPQGMAFHPDGSLYLADYRAHRVWRVTPTGEVTPVAGTGTAGYSGDGGAAIRAQLHSPWGITIDSQGTVYVADFLNSAVRRIRGGNIATVVGNGRPTIPTSGQPATGPVPFPTAVALDSQGNLIVGSIPLMRFASAGTGPLQLMSSALNYGFGGDGGSVSGALFETISSITVAPDQSLIVSDSYNHRVRRINPLGIISTIAGADRTAFNGPATNANISPQGLAVDKSGNLYIGHIHGASTGILRVNASGAISRFAGSGSIRPVANGGSANSGMVPRALAMDADDASILYAEGDSIDRNAVRRVRGGLLENVAGRVKTANNTSLIVTGNSGDGGPAESALLNDPFGVWADANGVVYIADSGNRRVRRVQGANIAAFAGSGASGSGGDGGQATQAQFRFPTSVVGDRRGNIYIADFGSHRIRRVTPAGVISTYAGNGNEATSGDGGPAADAALEFPYYLAVDAQDNLYVTTGSRVRKIDGNGTITTIAGTGNNTFSGDGGAALEAGIPTPNGIAVATDGRIFVADGSGRVRLLTPVAGGGGGGGGTASSRAMAAVTGTDNQAGAPGSTLPRPLTVRVTDSAQPAVGVPVDFAVVAGSATLSAARVLTGSDGTASVTVTLGSTPGNSRIRAAAPNADPVEFTVTTLRADGIAQIRQVISASAFGGDARVAPGTWVEITGANLATATREWAGSDFVNGRAPTALDGVSVTIGGRAASVRYISPGQVNAQLPFDLAPGPQPVRVTTAAGASEPVTVQVAARVLGLLAPPGAFTIGGRQFLAALFADGSFVLAPNTIAGFNTRRARAGDRILVYAIGCGQTTPANESGLPAPSGALPDVTVRIGGVPATVEYAGTSPGAFGLYQFNLVVPAGVTGDAAVTLSVGGVAAAQQTFLAVE